MERSRRSGGASRGTAARRLSRTVRGAGGSENDKDGGADELESSDVDREGDNVNGEGDGDNDGDGRKVMMMKDVMVTTAGAITVVARAALAWVAATAAPMVMAVATIEVA